MSTRADSLAVSVIIPTYNRAHLIARALRSVLAAVAPDDEIIVVDDGSTDGTKEVLAPFAARIRYVLGPHRGCGAARNAGIAAATKPLVAFNDSDDEWVADRLILQRAFMRQRPDVLFCFSDFGLRGDDGHQTLGGLFGWHHDARPWDEILGPGVPYSTLAPLPAGRADFRVHVGDLFPAMLRANYVASQTALVRREWAGDAFRFADDVKIHEDLECFARLARRGPAAYFDCVTFWQWGHAGPRVSGADDLRWATDRIKVLERTWGRDEAYLARHGVEYRQALAAERITRARALIRTGRGAEARAELRAAGGGPLHYRVLAALPGGVVQMVHSLRHVLRAGVGLALLDDTLLSGTLDALAG